MDLVAVFPDPPPPELARTLDLGGYRQGSMNGTGMNAGG